MNFDPEKLQAAQDNERIRYLVRIAVHGLENMYDEKERLFCYRSALTGGRLLNEGHSIRYSLISLLGLFRYEDRVGRSSFDIPLLLDSLLRRCDRIDSLGDIGLLLWLCSLAEPSRIREIANLTPLNSAMDRYRDGSMRLTTELSWFLAGLVYAVRARVDVGVEVEQMARDVSGHLRKNWGRKGIFSHQAMTNMSGLLRGRIGCFADQVYPIYALSKFFETFEDDEAKAIVKECVVRICEHQGSMGQWWWHYDALTGRVRGHYPVFSVHQHAMAPMALIAAGGVTGADYSTYLYKGLDWIAGKNELSLNLVDPTKGMIWRSLSESRAKMLLELAISGILPFQTSRGRVFPLYECRPYCLGWLLYALA